MLLYYNIAGILHIVYNIIVLYNQLAVSPPMVQCDKIG